MDLINRMLTEECAATGTARLTAFRAELAASNSQQQLSSAQHKLTVVEHSRHLAHRQQTEHKLNC